MKILLSNDDGYQAAGLRALMASLDGLPGISQLTVVAPDRNRSAASNSLTLDLPIRAHKNPDGVIQVNGTPTDCVHLAITGLLDEEPDMVIAGINAGANMGDDVLYSGTVAAATEGRFLGLPAIAISLESSDSCDYAAAGKIAAQLITRLIAHPLAADTILNVNVPALPFDEIKGFKATRLGARHKAEAIVKSSDPRGEEIYWIGPAGAEQDAGPGTDFHAVRNGYVSVTPLMIDLTHHSSIGSVGQWLQD